MKKSRITLVADLCVFAVSVVCCQATLITNNAFFAYTGPDILYDWIALLEAPSTPDRHTGLSAVIGEVGVAEYEIDPGVLGALYALYPATPGQEFSSIDVFNLPSAFGSSNNPVSFAPGETKYYAYWADFWGTDVDVPDAGDDFGWVSLTYTGAELVVSDSAVALGGGIIVGTYIQIPEPSTMLLLVLGALGLYRRMRLS